MADLDGFDANTVEPRKEFDTVPPGEYLAVITASELKITNAGTGKFLELLLEITEGAHKGRQLRYRINRENPNPTAVQIGTEELAALCRAVGVMTPQDSSALHDRPFLVSVGSGMYEGKPREVVKGCRPKTPAASAKLLTPKAFMSPKK